jgi:hypothetical protein
MELHLAGVRVSRSAYREKKRKRNENSILIPQPDWETPWGSIPIGRVRKEKNGEILLSF